VELYLHPSNTPLWHGAQLNYRDIFTFCLIDPSYKLLGVLGALSLPVPFIPLFTVVIRLRGTSFRSHSAELRQVHCYLLPLFRVCVSIGARGRCPRS
jgi:hypothetical protein